MLDMLNALSFLAFIGPGGPELLVVMLVLLLMFGAKDAPRILRKLNEFFSRIRNTADGFKREVMYGDLTRDVASHEVEEPGEDEDGGEDTDESVPEPESLLDEDGDAQKS